MAGGRRRPLAGLIAVSLTATLPAFIAHGALATTDVAFAGMFLPATLALWRWFEAPTIPRSLALGAAAGLALLCKFSTLVFFPATVLALIAARRLAAMPARPLRHGRTLGWRPGAGQLALAALAGFLVTWAGYRFSVGRIDDLMPEVKGWLTILPPVAERTGVAGLMLRTRLPNHRRRVQRCCDRRLPGSPQRPLGQDDRARPSSPTPAGAPDSHVDHRIHSRRSASATSRGVARARHGDRFQRDVPRASLASGSQ
jgi:hypothetical protein